MNRNKLLKHLIGQLSTAVVHRILEESIDDEPLRKYYEKETLRALEKAIEYRQDINPPETTLSPEEATVIRGTIIRNAKNELEKRQKKGYSGIDLAKAETVTDQLLMQCSIRQG